MSHAFAELAKRTEEITPFLAVEVFERAQELERQGHEVDCRTLCDLHELPP